MNRMYTIIILLGCIGSHGLTLVNVLGECHAPCHVRYMYLFCRFRKRIGALQLLLKIEMFVPTPQLFILFQFQSKVLVFPFFLHFCIILSYSVEFVLVLNISEILFTTFYAIISHSIIQYIDQYLDEFVVNTKFSSRYFEILLKYYLNCMSFYHSFCIFKNYGIMEFNQ